MLTDQERAELERLGPKLVRKKLVHSGSGRTAAVPGFAVRGGSITRSEIEDWLAEKDRSAQSDTLWWAKVAGYAGIAGVIATIIIGIAGIILTVWLTKK